MVVANHIEPSALARMSLMVFDSSRFGMSTAFQVRPL